MLKQRELTEEEKEALKIVPSTQLKLTTLTPVSIGAGKESILSHLVDVIVENKTAYYINHQLLEKQFEKRLDVLDRYVRQVHNSMDNQQSDFDLKAFIQKEKLGKFDSLVSHELSAYDLAGNRKQIIGIVKNAGKPYIAGSSLKGAIKTALLYEWLTTQTEGKTFLKERIIQKIQHNSFDVAIAKQELITKMKDFDKALRLVSDTNVLEMENVALYNTKRLHIKKGDFTIPQPREAIRPNALFSFSLQWKGEIASVLKAIHHFATINLQYEQTVLQRFKESLKNLQGKDDAKLVGNYENILGKLSNLENVALLRVGAGKSYFWNSVGLALLQKNGNIEIENDVFAKFRRLCKLGKREQKLFPLTRTLTTRQYLPLGWVAIQIASDVRTPHIEIAEEQEKYTPKLAENASQEDAINLLAQKFSVNKGNKDKKR